MATEKSLYDECIWSNEIGYRRKFYIKARAYRDHLGGLIRALKSCQPEDFKNCNHQNFPIDEALIKRSEFELFKWNEASQSPEKIGEYRTKLRRNVEAFSEKIGIKIADIRNGEFWLLQNCLRQFETLVQMAKMDLISEPNYRRMMTHG